VLGLLVLQSLSLQIGVVAELCFSLKPQPEDLYTEAWGLILFLYSLTNCFTLPLGFGFGVFSYFNSNRATQLAAVLIIYLDYSYPYYIF